METDTTTIGFRLQTNLIVVDVEINGQPAPFLLDTGASATVLSERFAEAIGIPKVRAQAGAGAGGGVPTWMADVASIGLGDLRTGRSTCAIMRLDHLQERIGENVMGILGFDFLGRGVVTIDYPARQVTLRWPRLPAPETIRIDDGRIVLPLERLAWASPPPPWATSRDTPLASLLAVMRHPSGATMEVQLVRSLGVGLEQAIPAIRASLELQIEAYEAGTSEVAERAGRQAVRLRFTGVQDGVRRRYLSEAILSPGGLVLVTTSVPEDADPEVSASIDRFLASAAAQA